MMYLRNSSRRVTFLLTVGLVLGLSGSALAFNLTSFDGREPARWEQSDLPIEFEVEDNFGAVSSDSDESAILNSFDSWEDISCSYMAFEFDGFTTGSAFEAYDGVTKVVYTTQGFSNVASGAVGYYAPEFEFRNGRWWQSGGDIAIDRNTDWSTDGGTNGLDLEATVTHEVGHLIGMQHSPVVAATMWYASLPPGDTAHRSLHEDDINGACYMYPNSAFSCSDNSECPTLERIENDAGGEPILWGRSTCQSDGSCEISGLPPGSPIGTICVSESDCESSLCIANPSAENNVCSEICDPDDDNCPGGFLCGAFEDGSGACIPEGTGQLGDSCEGALDCSSTLCAPDGDNDQAICVQECDPQRTGTCPGGVCWENDNEDLPYICYPGGDTPFGGSCTSNSECEGTLCLGLTETTAGRCASLCDFGAPTLCPDNASCYNLGAEQEFFVCIPGGALPWGSTCELTIDGVQQCRDALCLNIDGDDGVCSEPCDFIPGVQTCSSDETRCYPLELGAGCIQSGELELGDECARGFDCESLVCVVDGDSGICSEFCSGSCPLGYECLDLDDGLGACFPVENPGGDTGTGDTDNDDMGQDVDDAGLGGDTGPAADAREDTAGGGGAPSDEDEGCSVAKWRGSPGLNWSVLLGLVAAFTWSRRRYRK